MDGDLDEIIDSLIAADQAAKLSNMQENQWKYEALSWVWDYEI